MQQVYLFLCLSFCLWVKAKRGIVIGHGIDGKVIPAKIGVTCWKLVAGVSNDGPSLSLDFIATQQVMALKSKFVDATY